MIQTSHRLDSGFQQAIDQPIVEIQPYGIASSATCWKDSRPGDRESISLKAQFFHQSNIIRHAVVMVCSHVARIIVADIPLPVGINVPNAFTLAVLIPSAFDLVSGS